MPISSYPRVTVQGTSNAQNPQNGSSLMIFNPSTNKYEAVTAATLGGGDATSANQTLQITEAITSNNYLANIEAFLTDIKNELITLNASLINGDARVVITDTEGRLANVDASKKALNINDVT